MRTLYVLLQLALYVLSFLNALDLCRAAQTCQYWRLLAEDNLLWREKCIEENISESFVHENRLTSKRFVACKSPWKAAFMRQQLIEYNWREAKIRPPKVWRPDKTHVHSHTSISKWSDERFVPVFLKTFLNVGQFLKMFAAGAKRS